MTKVAPRRKGAKGVSSMSSARALADDVPLAPLPSTGMSIALVLWSGSYGGAETWSIALCRSMARRGIRSGLVVVGDPEPLLGDCGLVGVPIEALRLGRGAEVMLHPRAIAHAISRISPEAVIVPSGGYLSAAIRFGGYRGRIVAVEHGTVLQLRGMARAQFAVRQLDMLSGIWAVDAQVVPSEFMMRELRAVTHRDPVIRIYPGLDTSLYRNDRRTRPPRPDASALVLGFGGRLIKGKGLEVVIRALREVGGPGSIRLEVAGDGPERADLERLARSLGVAGNVSFRGWVRDMRSFWEGCDIAIVPSNEWKESFGMVAVEAMACGLPVIASRNGGLSEVIADGETGYLFEPGDHKALAGLLAQYSRDPALRSRHGEAANHRFFAKFDIDRCAEEFEGFIRGLT